MEQRVSTLIQAQWRSLSHNLKARDQNSHIYLILTHFIKFKWLKEVWNSNMWYNPRNSFVQPPVDIMRRRFKLFCRSTSLTSKFSYQHSNCLLQWTHHSHHSGKRKSSILLMGESSHVHGFVTAYTHWWPCILNFSKMTWFQLGFIHSPSIYWALTECQPLPRY